MEERLEWRVDIKVNRKLTSDQQAEMMKKVGKAVEDVLSVFHDIFRVSTIVVDWSSAKKNTENKQCSARSEISQEQENSLSHEITPLSVKTLWDGYYTKRQD